MTAIILAIVLSASGSSAHRQHDPAPDSANQAFAPLRAHEQQRELAKLIKQCHAQPRMAGCEKLKKKQGK